MLINPAAIVAFLLYLIAGPLAVSQRFQTRFKSLGNGVHQKISSVLSLPRASFEPQDYLVPLETTAAAALPITPAETDVIRPVKILPSCAVPLEDYLEIITPEVCPTRYDNNPSPAPAQAFVSPECRRPFEWRNLFNYQVLDVLTAIYLSIWFPLVAIPSISKLFSRSESPDEVRQPVDVQPKPLPPKILAPSPTVHIQFPRPPLEPIFSPAPPAPSTFWLTSEQRQDQSSSPSHPLLRFLGLPALESGSEDKLSPLSSPADSGYGTTLPDAASDTSSLVSEKSATTTPEYLTEPLPTAAVESTFVHGFKSLTITEKIDTTGFDTELEDDDDDGSTTVTNSIANLANPISCPAPVPTEELVARLESVMTTSIDEVKSVSELSLEEPSVIASPSAVDLPSHNEPTMAPPDDEPVANLVTVTQASAVDEIPVNSCCPCELPSDTTNAIAGPIYVDRKGTGLEAAVEIPTIVITPPSEVDPEDFAQQLDSEEEQGARESSIVPEFRDQLEPDSDCGGSEYDDDSELEYPHYPAHPVDEAALEPPQSPVDVRDDPCRSPIIVTGMLWSDNEGDDLGPLPFTEEITHAEETHTLEPTDTADIAEQPGVIDALEQNEARDSKVGEPVAGVIQELVQELQLAPETPAQEVAEPSPAVPFPSPSPSPHLQNPLPASRSHLTRAQASLNKEDRGEGSSRNSGTLESPRLQYYHCCKLFRSEGRPKSWENWKFEKPEACIPKKTHLQVWQFVRPMDKDGQNPTMRIAIDNLDADWFRMIEGVPSYNYLTEAMEFFSTKSFRCWRGRTIDGVEYSSIGYATVDFGSLDEAIRMFNELQGKRLRGYTWHWRLEFVDPNDDTHGGRKVIRTDLVPDSVKRALAAELEASTRRNGRSSSSDNSSADAAVTTRPPVMVRPHLSIGARSLFSGAMANVVQDRRTEERPVWSVTRVPHRRPHRP